jgi:hypothetical protein
VLLVFDGVDAERRDDLLGGGEVGCGSLETAGKDFEVPVGCLQFVFVAAPTQRSVELGDDRLAVLAALFQLDEGALSFPLLVLGSAQLAGQDPKAAFGALQVRGELMAALHQPAQDGAVEEPGPVGWFASELSLAEVGGLVDPVAGEAAGEDGSGGVFSSQGEVGVVRVGAAAHGYVQVPHITSPVHHQQGVVDGAALGGGRGGGVGQLDMLGHVAGREVNEAVPALGGETVVGMDGRDGPAGAVADHLAAVGDELAVVAARCDLIAHEQPHVGLHDTAAVDVEVPGVQAAGLAAPVEPVHELVGGGQQGDGLTGVSVRPPRGAGTCRSRCSTCPGRSEVAQLDRRARAAATTAAACSSPRSVRWE